MELKSFAENDFDPKKWINKAWSSNGNQDKEVFVANTVSRLQLYMKQLSNSLDETTTQIINSVPRILQDASALQLEGSLLQQQLVSLQQKVEDVQQETGHSIESLQRIHTLKSSLENAASALREADKWAALVASLEDMLESGVPTQMDKLSELSQQLTAITASLEVLSDAPDYEQKRLQLETLYNRLEATITPPFIEALTQMNAERTATYVSVFAGMSRRVSACRCWRRAAAARLSTAWRGQDTHLLSSLTRLLAGEANSQVEWLTTVLQSESPLAELIRLYTDLLLSLEPSPNKVVSANLKLCSSPEEGILLLTDLRTDIDQFVHCIRGVIDAPRNNKETVLPAVIKEFGRAAYSPLRELLPHYTDLQTQLFMAHLKNNKLQQGDLLDQSRLLLSLSERCDGWLSAAHGRAVKIANMAVYPFFVPAVESFISAISNLMSSHARHIESSFLSSMKQDAATGVLSNTFPATLVLESAVAELLRLLAGQTERYTWEDTKDQYPLEDIPLLLLEKETREKLPSYKEALLSCSGALQRTKEQLKALSRAILRSPVNAQLDKIPHLSVWNNNDAMATDLPDFALSPQEYITEIGQYLMTLPQHLEMHLSEKQAPWHFLNDVCTHTCDVYAEKILNIRNMDALGTKRCLTDIVYLSSVVEDLGTNVTQSLKNLEKSLRSTAPNQSE